MRHAHLQRPRSILAVAAVLLLASCSGSAPGEEPRGSGGESGTGGEGPGGSVHPGSGGLGGSGAGSGGKGGVTTGSGGHGAGGRGGGAGGAGGGAAGATGSSWVGTWVTAPQLTETNNNPPSPGLTNSTLRQIVHVSIGGSQLRLRLSNEFGNAAVTVNKAHLAAATTTAGAIDTATDKALAFGGNASVTIPAGQAVTSDPFSFPLTALGNVVISLAFGSTASGITGHPGSRTTSYLKSGDLVSAATLSGAATTDHWYIINGIDVMAPASSRAVVVLGDSITDGRGSTTNGNDRWPDALARRLQANPATMGVGVLNQGIGGNAVLSGGLGPTAKARFSRDVLGQSGVRYLIILEGVNDIGSAPSDVVGTQLIAAYQQLITDAKAKGILVYGVPILPFGGNAGYDSTLHQSIRTTVNDWIRTSGKFDAVIDLDAAVHDSSAPTKLQAAYDSGDHLHLNPAGYQKMADAIDLTLFTR